MSTANLELDLARLQIQKTLGRFKRETEEAQLHQTNIDEAVEKFKKEAEATVDNPYEVFASLQERIEDIDTRMNSATSVTTLPKLEHLNFKNSSDEERYWNSLVESLPRPAYEGSRTPRFIPRNRKQIRDAKKPDEIDRNIQSTLKQQRLRVARLIRPSNYKSSVGFGGSKMVRNRKLRPAPAAPQSPRRLPGSPSPRKRMDGQWKSARDPRTGKYYLYNRKTKETRWA